MKDIRLFFQLTACFLIISCSMVGKKTPHEIVWQVIGEKKSSQSVVEYIKSGGYSIQEIQSIAQKSIEQSQCSLAYDLVKNFQIDPNLRSDTQTLFQCLLLNKYYQDALHVLKSGAAPEFIRHESVYRNDALEEASAWGEIEIVRELLRLGERPSSRAFFLAVSGHYHRDYDKSLSILDLYKKYIMKIDINYEFVKSPLLYEVATERKYSLQQRLHLSKAILELGADPNKGVKRTEHGKTGRNIDYIETAYMAVSGTPELTALFLAYGADAEQGRAKEYAKFIANLIPGDEAKQGLVVQIKDNLVLVQTASGTRWVKIEEIRPSK
ncbi:hypothetical protein FE848_18325 [Marinobacter sp. 1-3A]|uniref:hypothetical protein n=1 Tax=Marinobacter sp. 1-3A TaxID=2582920 RepID=UPI001905586E|nr:hypothetical protein [Marinobacter sp. 1-3A]MBK1875178.1 hypothetical protein [Marinobacter sp. 1-3A]